MKICFFFDGRTSHDIGGFSATYTANYRLNATDRCMTTLTGVGGECLRNHFCVKGKSINADAFFDDVIFNSHFRKTAGEAVYRRIAEKHLSKCEQLLDVKLHGKVNRINLRRYYSEIMMPEGQGHVIDAYNLVSWCVAPFLDWQVLSVAYCGMPYLGYMGEYESIV